MREVNLLVKFASCLLELGDETRAHALFDEAVSANPKEVDAWFHRGQMRLIEGDLKRAKEDLQRVAKLNPNHEMAFVQLGFCFAQEQRFDMAIENMKRAVSCQDCPAAVFVHYGEMMNMMTRLGEAEELFKLAFEKDRTWPYSYVNLATLELQARNDYLKAFEYLEKAIQVDGTCVAAFVQRAQLYMLMQENAKASEDLEKAMAQCRTSSDLKQVCGMKISLQFQTEALEKFQPPIVTVDMGTATTIGVISEGRNYEGGMLLPGVNVSLEALSRRAAQLPAISLQHPKVLIGKTTEDCMRSGIVYGTAGMLDGVIDRIREQFPGRTLSVVATGGNAPVIVKYCRNKIVYDKYLLMDGLWAIYQKNK